MRSALAISAALLLGLSTAAGDARAHLVEPHDPGDPVVTAGEVRMPCEDGFAGEYPCRNVDLVSFVSLSDIGQRRANDIWGWTDPETGVEYALLGLDNGTAFFDLSDPASPVFVGLMPSRVQRSTWRDIKVDGSFAFVVSEARSHGMQVFDLRRLGAVATPPVPLLADTVYRGLRTSHNLAMNEETDFIYAVGTNDCRRGMHIVDVSDPLSPVFAGCYGEDGYTHDAQCVLYRGPDVDYWGREICFNSNIDTVTIVDVTDKSAPILVSKTPYEGARYVHQGWLTEDQAYFLVNDEFDEDLDGVPTTTYVLDVSDLDQPFLSGLYEHDSTAIDHNLYVLGRHVFEANYRAGIRILRLGDLSEGELGEVAYFDTIPWDDAPSFSGTWSVYPNFESGVVVASDMFQGLFVLRPDLDAISECSDGIDNDGDGRRDHPEDTACVDAADASESLRMDVRIDLLSRWRSHRLNLADTTWLRVAVLGSETVDVRDVDRFGLRFGPGRASPVGRGGASGWLGRRGWQRVWSGSGEKSHLWPAAGRRAKGPRPPGRLHDYDRDGHTDLLMRFRVSELGLAPGEVEACLQGEIGGDPFAACDLIEVVDEACDGGGGGNPWASPWRPADRCLGQWADAWGSRRSWGAFSLVRWLTIRAPLSDFVRLDRATRGRRQGRW